MDLKSSSSFFRSHLFLFGLFSFLAGSFFATGMWFLGSTPSSTLSLALRQSDLNPTQPYALIDPLIGLKPSEESLPPDFASLQKSIQSFVQTAKKQNAVEMVSVNVSDIKRGVRFTVNPDEKYYPSSLLKVPTMMAYFKLAETDPNILKTTILYTGSTDENLEETIRSPIELVAGMRYSVSDLINHMVRYSDNNAAELLIENLNATNHADAFNTLFKDLGINEVSLNEDYITIQAYNLFFRVLYNATYLSRAMSEKALSILTETDFTKGIEAGIPNNITVAHKFGEFNVRDSATKKVIKTELHDCGIVYYPEHPYTLCIMTKGGDTGSLQNTIGQISRLAFEYFEKMYPAPAKN